MLFFLLLQSSNDKSNVHLKKGEMSEKQIPDFPDVWNYLTLNMHIMKSLFAHLLTKTAHPQYSISWQMTSKCNFYPKKNLAIIVICSLTFQVCLKVLLVFLLKKKKKHQDLPPCLNHSCHLSLSFPCYILPVLFQRTQSPVLASLCST